MTDTPRADAANPLLDFGGLPRFAAFRPEHGAPAIDALIAAMLAANTREEFVTAMRTYDRVLLSNFYIVPLFHTVYQWDAHWSRIERPEALPKWAAPLFAATLDTWWSAAT